MALPYIGPYAASKFALRALTDSLRVELAPWGIAVCLVEPGNVSTPIWNKSKSLGIDLRTGRTGIRTRGQSHHDRAMQTIEQTFDSSLSPGT